MASKDKGSLEHALDHEIVEMLQTSVLPGFSLNLDLLYHWQTELSDVATDPTLLTHAIRHEIVLQYPPGPVYFTEDHRQAIQACFSRVDALDSDVYLDFKLIVHEVIFCATTALHTGKLQLFRGGILDYLVGNFLTHACLLKDDSPHHDQLICRAKSRILASFLDLGCDSHQFKRLFVPLLSKTSHIEFAAKKVVLSLLFCFLRRCPTTYSALIFSNFLSRRVAIPINPDLHVSKCFTVAAWFKVNGTPELASSSSNSCPLTLLSLANTSDRNSLAFQIQLCNKKFLVTISNGAPHSKRQFTFNHAWKQNPRTNNGFTHLVLTYDSSQNLNLYVDGEYSESIPCASMPNSWLSKADIRWNKLYVGDPSDPSERDDVCTNLFAKQELLVKDLAVMDIACTFEWVSLYYFLGIGFDWSQKEFSESNILGFLHCLSKPNYILMSYRVESILNSRGKQVPYRGETRSVTPASRKGAASSGSSTHLPSKEEIVGLLAKSRTRASNFLFDINDSQFIDFIDSSRSQEILYHRFNSFCNSLYCWGGSGLLLSIIEAVMKYDYTDERHRDFLFFETSRLLLSCLQSDWRVSKEFENIDGYWALVLLSSFYKLNYNAELAFPEWAKFLNSEKPDEQDDSILCPALFDGSFLRMLIAFSTTRHESGIFISNSLAFKVLALNFDLFSSTMSFSSLHNYISDLLATEKYRSLNSKELSKMKVLKNLLHHIKMCLLEGTKARKIEELTRLLGIFIHFDSASEESQQAGLQALLSLTNKLCGPSSSIKSLKKFSRSISIHWILLLLDFEGSNKPMSAKVVCCAIGLLSKFLRVLGPHVINRFFHANKGLNVLSYFLQSWWNNDNVISVLFMNSFGVDSDGYGSNIPSLPELVKDKNITHVTSNIPIPDFVNLLNKLALTGVTQLAQKKGKVLSTPSSPVRSFSTRSSPNHQDRRTII
ncbi:hypothetical protein JCM33374_g3790 [Metschnikowia sp. JCM 33374]|nr:hypothetical protein JCM33374_g3790 [Metschnikowia sp. JCM 33374]